MYVVNGESRESDKFKLKQRWMSAFGNWLQSLPETPPLLVVGDFNVAPEDRDVWNPVLFKNHINCTEEERKWLRTLQDGRLRDLLRSITDKPGIYTWWPYGKGFDRDEGMRIDLALGDKTTEEMVDLIRVDKEARMPGGLLASPSDHAPLIIEIKR